MNTNIHDTILKIKKDLRLSMNGVVSSLQRKQGLNYKINFGVEIPRIKSIATEYQKNKELAIALWKENIRECKLLAIYLMPIEEFSSNDAHEWVASTEYTEIADNLAMNLLHKTPTAMEQALTWIEKDEHIFQYCGYITLSHLFKKGETPVKEDEKRYLNAIENIFSHKESNNVIRMCAHNSLIKYIDTNHEANAIKMECYPCINNFYQKNL